MKISHKLSIGFALVATPITIFSILAISYIQQGLQEVNDFHQQNLYSIQNIAIKTTKAVEASFAYVASGYQPKKSEFLAWSQQVEKMNADFMRIEGSIQELDEDLTNKIFVASIVNQTSLIKQAKALFAEFESNGRISTESLLKYENNSNKLLNQYQELIDIEKRKVDFEKTKAIQLIQETLEFISILGLLTILSSMTSSYFIARTISQPITKLKSAMSEVAKGNLDTSIERGTKDEIGDLAISFSQMVQDLEKSREELILNKNWTNNIINSMSDALIVLSANQIIMTANQATYMMLKYQEDDLVGQHIGKIVEAKDLLLDHNTQTSNNAETVYVAKDGSKISVLLTSSIMLDEYQEIQGIVCVAKDITERKRAEAVILKTLEREKYLNELKSRFVTMTSHEFRTPLTTILSSTELLQDYCSIWTEDKKMQHFQRIASTVKYMTQLLNDVLLFSKAEAGKLEFQPMPLDLKQFCQDLVEEMQLSSPRHLITFSSQGSCDRAGMDEKLLRQIFSNLISNAIKYSPAGSAVKFDLVCQSETAILQVQDCGIGIPPTDQAELFKSFHRASNVGTISGTGLGLAIVKKSIDLHGGKITFASKVGAGTTFEVTLPLQCSVCVDSKCLA